MNIRILSGIVALGLAMCQAGAYDFVTGGVAYDIVSNTQSRKTAAVTYMTLSPDATGYISTYKGDITIPAQVSWNMETFNVTRVGDVAMFNNQALRSIRLPEGVTAIGSQAFSHCYSMTEISLPSTLSRVADYAFEYCEDLTAISFPAKLQEFGSEVFYGCYGLTRVDVDPDCTEFKSIDGVMYGRLDDPAGMKLLICPGAGLKDFVMPPNVATVDDYAFSANRSLKSLNLSEALVRLPEGVFLECESLEEVNAPESNVVFSSEGGVLYDKARTMLVYYPSAKTEETFEVPAGIETIEGMAVCGASALKELTLPATLREVGELAFLQTSSLDVVTCNAVTPPSWLKSDLLPSAGLFDDMVYSRATLFVPEGCIEAYKKASGWSRFSEIRPIGWNGLDTIEEETAVEYYDLQGHALKTPAEGVSIVRDGRGHTIKAISRIR